MKRYNEKFELTEQFLNDLTNYMDHDLVEKLHFELAPCEPIDFLTKYLEIKPEFETVLKDEFSITID